jgi:hypothetical protein
VDQEGLGGLVIEPDGDRDGCGRIEDHDRSARNFRLPTPRPARGVVGVNPPAAAARRMHIVDVGSMASHRLRSREDLLTFRASVLHRFVLLLKRTTEFARNE